MKVAFRAVAVAVLLSLTWAGPLAPLAAAQQMFQDQTKPASEERGTDVYDAAAAALTALGLPFKGAICAIGFAFGGIVMAASFASRPDAAFGILDEGCGSKARWIVHGNELRPRASATKAFEWETHHFEWER